MDINITKPAGVVLKTAQKYCSEDISVIPVLEDITVTPTTTEQVITPTTGKAGISKVTLEAVTSTIDSNIVADNIKKDVTILGVTGTLEQGGAEAVLGTLNVTSNGTYNAVNALSLEPGELYMYKKVLPREVLAELKTKTSNTDLLFCVPSLDVPAVAVFIKEVGGEYVLEQINGEIAVSIYATGNTNISIGNTNLAVNSGWNSYVNGDSAVSSIETSCIRLPKDLTNFNEEFINLLDKPFDTINEIEMSIDTSGTVTIPDLGSYHKASSFPADVTKQYLAPLSFMKYDEFSDLSTDESYNNLINLLILRSSITSFKLQDDISGLKYLQMNSPETGAVKFLIYVEDSSQVQVTNGEVETGYWYVSSNLSEMIQNVTWVQEKDFVDGYNKVIVDVAPTPTQEKTIEIISNKTTEVTPDTGKALSKVTITTNVQPELGTLNATSNGTYNVSNSISLSLEPGGLYEYKKVLPKEVLAELANISNNRAIFGIPNKEGWDVVGVIVKEQAGEYALMQVAGRNLISCYATADITITLDKNYNFKAGWNVVLTGGGNPTPYDTCQIRLPLDISDVPESFINLLSKQFSKNDAIEMSIDTSKVVTISGLGKFCKVTSFPINPETQNLVVSSIMGYNEVSDFASADSSGQQAIISCAQMRQSMSGSNLRTDIAGIKYLSAPYFSTMGMGLGSVFLIYVEDASKIQVSSGSVETGCWYIEGPDLVAPMFNGSTWAREKKPLDGYNKVIVDVPGTPTQEKTIEITTNGTTEITPDVDKTLSKVTVTTDVQPVLQEKTIDIIQNGTAEIIPDSGKVLSKVTVTTDVQPVFQEKTVEIAQNGTTEVTPDIGKALSKVIVTADVQPTLQEKTVKIAQNGTTEVTPDNGKVLSKVTVTTDVKPTLQEKTVVPSAITQEIVADDSFYGLSKVTVEEVTSSIDKNIIAQNIKNGVTILGVTGALEGSQISEGNYIVKVIDYDGTVLLEQKGNSGDVIELPTAPTHDKLIFEEWSASVSVTNNTVTIGNSDIMVGAIYKPTSGKSEFDITLTPVTGLSVALRMDGTKEWGDGTSDTEKTHTYTAYGDYTIMCDGTTIRPPDQFGTSNMFETTSEKNYSCVRARLANITNIPGSAFSNCCSLTNITIPSSVTSISYQAFYRCYSLTNIIIPSSVTDIWQNVFEACSSLTNIIIPISVTNIGSSSFFNCVALTNIIIPNSITNINSYTFKNCQSLVNVTMSKNIKSIGQEAFSNCYSLTNITIPNGVTTIDTHAFQYCYSLTDITIPSGVTSIDSAFAHCISLKNITIPSSVTSIGSFYNCGSLKNITIPNGVTTIGPQEFYGCRSLTNIIIPSSVTNIGTQAFCNCYSITKYDFSQHTSVPTLSSTSTFENINKICKIIVPDDLAAEWIAATNWSTYADYIYKVSEVNGGGSDGNIISDANGNILQDSNGNNIEFTESVTLISFTIAGKSYQAEEGMTWEDWCNSDYNTGGFYVHNNKIGTTGTNFISTKNTQSTEYAEYPTNVIAKETVYYLPSFNITPPPSGGSGIGN